jgi:hypothetical protein
MGGALSGYHIIETIHRFTLGISSAGGGLAVDWRASWRASWRWRRRTCWRWWRRKCSRMRACSRKPLLEAGNFPMARDVPDVMCRKIKSLLTIDRSGRSSSADLMTAVSLIAPPLVNFERSVIRFS